MTTRRTAAGTGPRIGAVMRPFRTPVRGHPFAAPPPGATGPETGQPARLAREPGNPADPLAVAVWLTPHDDGGTSPAPWRIGYLDRGVAARVAPRLDDGLEFEARVEGWTPEPDGRWQRPLLLLVPAGLPAGPSPGRRAGSRVAAAASPSRTADDGNLGRGLWGRPPGVRVRRLG